MPCRNGFYRVFSADQKPEGRVQIMKIGIQELLLVFIVALVVIGPDKLPYYAKKFGQALAQFRKFSDEATKEIRESVVEPLEEAQRPLKEAMQPVTDLEKEVKGNLNEIQQSLKGIGKSSSSSAQAAAVEAAPAVQTVSDESKPSGQAVAASGETLTGSGSGEVPTDVQSADHPEIQV